MHNSKSVTYNGETYPSVAQACRALGLRYHTIQQRLSKGWDLERALSTPIRPYTQQGRTPEQRRTLERKVCVGCMVEKPFEEFHRFKRSADGRMSRCKACRRRQKDIYEYGVSREDLPSNCEICGEPADAIDHCHESGKVRGALCHPCNKGLGHFQDDPERLQEAIRYLEGKRADL